MASSKSIPKELKKAGRIPGPKQAEREAKAKAEILAALTPVKELQKEMERRYGFDVLLEYVDPEIAVKFERAKRNLQMAVEALDVDLVIEKAKNLINGMRKLESLANAKGLEAYREPDTFRHLFWDQQYVFVVDERKRNLFAESGDRRVYTLDEVCRIIQLFEERVPVAAHLKEYFRKAVISEVVVAPELETESGETEPDQMPFPPEAESGDLGEARECLEQRKDGRRKVRVTRKQKAEGQKAVQGEPF